MFKKIFWRGLITLFLLGLAVVILFIAANLRDQDLRPEVQAKLQWTAPKSIDEDNGFLILLGMNPSATVDPLMLGKHRLAAEIQRYQKDRFISNQDAQLEFNATEDAGFEQKKSDLCDYATTPDCVEFYLLRPLQQEQEILSSQKVLLQQFDRLLTSKDYVEIIPPHITAKLPTYGVLMHVAELKRMQALRSLADGKTEQGLSDLLEVLSFSQRWLAGSSNLISHMVALANLQRDLRILDEALQRFPALLPQVGKIQESLNRFSEDKMYLDRALKFESQVGLQLMQSMVSTQTESQANWLQGLIVKLLHRPNAALNLTYDWHALWDKLAQRGSRQYVQVQAALGEQQRTLLGMGVGMIYLRDPIIKILLTLSTPGFETYFQRNIDTFAYVKLFSLKLEILKQGIATADVAQFVQTHAAQYANPYDGKAMGWDLAKRQLFTDVRQSSNRVYQKSTHLSLSLPSMTH